MFHARDGIRSDLTNTTAADGTPPRTTRLPSFVPRCGLMASTFVGAFALGTVWGGASAGGIDIDRPWQARPAVAMQEETPALSPQAQWERVARLQGLILVEQHRLQAQIAALHGHHARGAASRPTATAAPEDAVLLREPAR